MKEVPELLSSQSARAKFKDVDDKYFLFIEQSRVFCIELERVEKLSTHFEPITYRTRGIVFAMLTSYPQENRLLAS